MRQVIEDVQKLMQASGQEPSYRTAKLYEKLMEEEYAEFLDSHTDADEFDACLDLIWVTVGYMLAKGWPVPAGWAEVARSNHAKIGADGKVLKREDGKILKAPGWTPPDLDSVLKEPTR